MVATVLSATILGLDEVPVDVETGILNRTLVRSYNKIPDVPRITADVEGRDRILAPIILESLYCHPLTAAHSSV